MSHAFDAASAASETKRAEEPRIPGLLGVIERTTRRLNHLILVCGGVALVAACLVLSYSVLTRYVFHEPTEWQDETAVFLIVGATFLSAAGVQAKRGHVAIEALTGLLSPGVNRVRLIFVDIVSLAFVTFFAWKSWSLFHEAWEDGQISQSTWGPPLWIPYLLMAAGMSLLAVQFVLQITEAVLYGPRAAGWAKPKIGIGADVNRDMRDRPDLTPEGPDPLESTITPTTAPVRPITTRGGKA
ncbi:MAG: TRAP transporter small permease [Methylorubrum extorquens]|jgi:TRAP-type C4-dicarboxylate transport system permease small subunit|uniref:TRAP transporter small permease protein n=1 Tax=Methylorubrum extorquens (strain DSM 6343 / CIP 106787 / DM4) TaxID=661410 RepID=C7CJY6_METED|nr:TRAP transporter small permease [Methylorubrum extorquens]CAX23626.1 putative tripartite ATP-independent periplasmic transporter, permease (DctQ) subunit; putative membrane protein [Methylorubrum extorquens DM4]